MSYRQRTNLVVVLVVRSDTLLDDVMLFDLCVVELAESSTVCWKGTLCYSTGLKVPVPNHPVHLLITGQFRRFIILDTYR